MLFDEGIDFRPQCIIDAACKRLRQLHVAHIPPGVSGTGQPHEDENNTRERAWLGSPSAQQWLEIKPLKSVRASCRRDHCLDGDQLALIPQKGTKVSDRRLGLQRE